jgi:AcrR family transcriptional regulator
MPRDATATKERLLREAERLFATRGVFRVKVADIVEAAGQRNVSALSYHFGGRQDVLTAILLRHGTPLDEERGRLVAQLGEGPSTRDLVGALLVPYGSKLSTPEGRSYLRIVAQLTADFQVWDAGGELSPPHLRRILGALGERPAQVAPAVRRQRVVEAIMLMTSSIADRARTLDQGATPDLDHDTYLANLADMIVGGLEADSGPVLRG